MKLTKTNVRKYAANTDSGLEKDVCKYILNEWDNYENKKDIFSDVLNHGCSTGIVGHLIYYSDILKYLAKHGKEINDLMSGYACSPKEIFGEKWNDDDPLAREYHNSSLIAWFGFEEAMYRVSGDFEIDF